MFFILVCMAIVQELADDKQSWVRDFSPVLSTCTVPCFLFRHVWLECESWPAISGAAGPWTHSSSLVASRYMSFGTVVLLLVTSLRSVDCSISGSVPSFVSSIRFCTMCRPLYKETWFCCYSEIIPTDQGLGMEADFVVALAFNTVVWANVPYGSVYRVIWFLLIVVHILLVVCHFKRSDKCPTGSGTTALVKCTVLWMVSKLDFFSTLIPMGFPMRLRMRILIRTGFRCGSLCVKLEVEFRMSLSLVQTFKTIQTRIKFSGKI